MAVRKTIYESTCRKYEGQLTFEEQVKKLMSCDHDIICEIPSTDGLNKTGIYYYHDVTLMVRTGQINMILAFGRDGDVSQLEKTLVKNLKKSEVNIV